MAASSSLTVQNAGSTASAIEIFTASERETNKGIIASLQDGLRKLIEQDVIWKAKYSRAGEADGVELWKKLAIHVNNLFIQVLLIETTCLLQPFLRGMYLANERAKSLQDNALIYCPILTFNIRLITELNEMMHDRDVCIKHALDRVAQLHSIHLDVVDALAQKTFYFYEALAARFPREIMYKDGKTRIARLLRNISICREPIKNYYDHRTAIERWI